MIGLLLAAPFLVALLLAGFVALRRRALACQIRKSTTKHYLDPRESTR